MPAILNTTFITGQAGTGKSTYLRTLLDMDPTAFTLTSTTGLSAVNLGCNTINSTLKYFDTDSLRDNYLNFRLFKTIKNMITGDNKVRGLAVDECSMLPADQLDIIVDTFDKVCKQDSVIGKIYLILSGDFAQLPPVKERHCFEAKHWHRFDDENTVKLTTMYRQDNEVFINALNMFRAGQGQEGVDLLKECGVEFHSSIDINYKGTTIVPKNDIVDSYNKLIFDKIDKPIIRIKSIRSGTQSSDWKESLIPEILELKESSLVMILSNDTLYKEYANGDLGIVESYDTEDSVFHINLLRNNKTVRVGCISRSHVGVDNNEVGRRVLGSVTYMPLRLAYAATPQKSQGLSLDSVQIDFTDSFFGRPSSLYVALSRCRTPEGLRLVGNERLMVRRCVIDSRVKRFL